MRNGDTWIGFPAKIAIVLTINLIVLKLLGDPSTWSWWHTAIPAGGYVVLVGALAVLYVLVVGINNVAKKGE